MAIRKCSMCDKWLSEYNKDPRQLCYSCIKIVDIDVIRSPATDESEKSRTTRLRSKKINETKRSDNKIL